LQPHLAEEIDHQGEHGCSSAKADAGDGSEESEGLHGIGAGDTESHESRADHDGRKDGSGAVCDGGTGPEFDQPRAECKQRTCGGGDQKQVAEECLQDDASELFAGGCGLPTGDVGEEEVEAGGGEPEDGLRELDAERIRGERDCTEVDAEHEAVQLAEDDSSEGLRPGEDAEA